MVLMMITKPLILILKNFLVGQSYNVTTHEAWGQAKDRNTRHVYAEYLLLTASINTGSNMPTYSSIIIIII